MDAEACFIGTPELPAAESFEEGPAREAADRALAYMGLRGGTAVRDIAVDTEDLSATRIGPIVANVEQFHSDNNLRDARIRQDFLESHRFPLATF